MHKRGGRGGGWHQPRQLRKTMLMQATRFWEELRILTYTRIKLKKKKKRGAENGGDDIDAAKIMDE